MLLSCKLLHCKFCAFKKNCATRFDYILGVIWILWIVLWLQKGLHTRSYVLLGTFDMHIVFHTFLCTLMMHLWILHLLKQPMSFLYLNVYILHLFDIPLYRTCMCNCVCMNKHRSMGQSWFLGCTPLNWPLNQF